MQQGQNIDKNTDKELEDDYTETCWDSKYKAKHKKKCKKEHDQMIKEQKAQERYENGDERLPGRQTI